MRLPIAFLWLMTALLACQLSTVFADDLERTTTGGHSSDAASPIDSGGSADSAESGEKAESPPRAPSDDVIAPPPFHAPFHWFAPVPPSPPEPSYEELSEGYPAAAHSLVPPALLTGPLLFGGDSPRTATSYGVHLRFPYYNYRSPWTYGGPASVNHTIIW